jgi:hypothetical protein
MKFAFFAAILVCAACAPPQTSRPAGNTAPGALPSRPAPINETKTPPNTVSQDAAECEREAAVSGSAGSRAQVFNDCMKARGRAPSR